ncbi:MAG: aminotransferase class V-fold PLP-dependent enzyme [Dethiobacteria bacterium]
MKKLYADNAATSLPKPPQVIEATCNFLKEIGCNPGRGGYRLGLEASRMVFRARELLASFFNVDRAERVVFTSNVTHSLNILLKGLLEPGDHVVTSSMEHNAVTRPLARLGKEWKIRVTKVPCAKDGTLDPDDLRKALQRETKLVVLTHASNVTGTILPVAEIGELCASRGIYFAIDAAQTAGIIPLDFKALQLDFLAFTGHKGLLGPPGTGGLCLSERGGRALKSLMEGGTGSQSHLAQQPEELPDKLECGTLNTAGIAGLAAGVQFINEKGGPAYFQAQEGRLLSAFLDGLREIKGITTYGPGEQQKQVATVSINIEGWDAGELSYILDQEYGIMTRSGLHCAPDAHKTIGTFPKGTLRFSFGAFNTMKDIEAILEALRQLKTL